MAWYVEIFLFGCVIPFFARSFQDKIKLRASHQSLALSLLWLGVQLSSQNKPSNNMILLGWLFIYGFGALVLLYGRIDDEDDGDGKL
jgi:hypothetical protein